MRFLLLPALLPGIAACAFAEPQASRLTLSNYSFGQARVETVTTANPDCASQPAAAAAPAAEGSSVFTLPLNGTRIIAAPPGADVCWRHELPREANVPAASPAKWSGWSRAYLAPGRAIDSTL